MHRQVNGPAIRALRMALGIKQQDLAERSGISPSHMNKIESGAESGRFEVAVSIAAALGVPIDAIAPVIKVPA
jgi:transcriptional regulator with XRE-family HTH domain